MPRRKRELSPVEIKRLSKKPGFWAVGGVIGLYLDVAEALTACWILRVKVGDKRPDLGCGSYPTVQPAQARERARAMRELIDKGIDPRAAKQAAAAALRSEQAKAITFSEAARQCHAAKSPEFRNRKHRADWINSIERYANPIIGVLPVGDVEVGHVVAVLTPIWQTKTETATRLRQRIEAVLSWAKTSGFRTGENPASWNDNLEHLLPSAAKIRKREHYAALPWQEVGAFIADLRKREGMAARALEFAILTAARSGEVRLATWDEIDLKAKLWTVSAERMKGNKTHRVPMSDPAVKLLKSLPRMEGSPYVFPAVRGGPLSDMSISAVCRRMGVEAVPHGFRSSFKDWARSSTNYPDEVSELALAHINSDKTRAAYARDELLPLRTKLMTEWAKYCATVPRKRKVTIRER